MSGTELDTVHYGFFRAFYPDMTDRNELYSVGYAPIGPSITAYVLRVPSRYATTAMALWLYHDDRRYWLPPLVVADAYGDADWSFRQDAWLVDRNADGFLDLVWRRTDWVADTVYTDSLKWRFWQRSFDDWGWQADLTDSAAAKVFTIPSRP